MFNIQKGIYFPEIFNKAWEDFSELLLEGLTDEQKEEFAQIRIINIPLQDSNILEINYFSEFSKLLWGILEHFQIDCFQCSYNIRLQYCNEDDEFLTLMAGYDNAKGSIEHRVMSLLFREALVWQEEYYGLPYIDHDHFNNNDESSQFFKLPWWDICFLNYWEEIAPRCLKDISDLSDSDGDEESLYITINIKKELLTNPEVKRFLTQQLNSEDLYQYLGIITDEKKLEMEQLNNEKKKKTLIMELLKEYGSLSFQEIMEKTGFLKTTVFNILFDMDVFKMKERGIYTLK